MKFWFILCAATLFLAGCSQDPGADTPPPEVAAETLEKTFEGAPPQARQSARAASEALKNEQFNDAFVALNSIDQSQISYEQYVATRQSMQALHRELAQRVLRGDTNAMRIVKQWEQLRNRR